MTMIRSIWEAFLGRLGRSVDTDGEESDSGFVPSPLDLSIREAHGGQDVRVEREFSKIHEQASTIDDVERER